MLPTGIGLESLLENTRTSCATGHPADVSSAVRGTAGY